ncbi:MAG: ATP-binding protein [Actinomycetota bacterium]
MHEGLDHLLLYREFGSNELARDMAALAGGGSEAMRSRYAGVFARLAAIAGAAGDPWRQLVRRAVLTEDTGFSRAARAGRSPSEALARAMRHDLTTMQALHEIDADALAKAAGEGESLPSWSTLGGDEHLEGIEAKLAGSDDWPELTEALWEYFAQTSAGAIGRHHAFRWTSAGLEPVANPDPVRLDDLVGYEEQKKPVVENTRILASGRRANNLLLYGPRGTGKSSTVKAVINEFVSDGIRMVQVDRTSMADWPKIIGLIEGSPEKFIVFLDDLTFEMGEHDYGHLKGLLDGGLQARPSNMVIYATSNRRHLVDERFGDRDDQGDPVHIGDLYEHKLSLADRFGIRVMFPPTDQAQYLEIVHALLRRRGIVIEIDEFSTDAIRWSATHNGFSPRTAQQYVDHASVRLEDGGDRPG